jgi:hypothetical protein
MRTKSYRSRGGEAKAGILLIPVVMMLCLVVSCQKGGMKVTDIHDENKTFTRERSTPEQGVIGHWMEEVQHTHIKRHLYVSSDLLFYVEYFEMPYQIIDSDMPNRTIKVNSGIRAGGQDRTFIFSKDMKTMTQLSWLNETPLVKKFTYVDSNTLPVSTPLAVGNLYRTEDGLVVHYMGKGKFEAMK